MKHPLFAFFSLCFAGLLPAELGCQPQVIGGGQGGSGGQSSGPGEPTSGPGGSVHTSGGGTTTIPAPSGNARSAEGGYIVTLADYPSACKDPGIQPECGPSRWWSNQFELKSSDLTPGTVLPLSGLDGVFSQQEPVVDGQLSRGYGVSTFVDGTVKIVAASATELTLEVAGTRSTSQPSTRPA